MDIPKPSNSLNIQASSDYKENKFIRKSRMLIRCGNLSNNWRAAMQMTIKICKALYFETSTPLFIQREI